MMDSWSLFTLLYGGSESSPQGLGMEPNGMEGKDGWMDGLID
jgi:hypothetical protein